MNCIGAIGVQAVVASSEVQRPAIAQVLGNLGSNRAAASLSGSVADAAMLAVLLDGVLHLECIIPAPEAKAAQAAQVAQADKKGRKKRSEKLKATKRVEEAVAQAKSEAPAEALAAAAAGTKRLPLTGAAKKTWRQKAVCFCCAEVGHIKNDDECSGVCGVCGADHDFNYHNSEMLALAREKANGK